MSDMKIKMGKSGMCPIIQVYTKKHGATVVLWGVVEHPKSKKKVQIVLGEYEFIEPNRFRVEALDKGDIGEAQSAKEAKEMILACFN